MLSAFHTPGTEPQEGKPLVQGHKTVVAKPVLRSKISATKAAPPTVKHSHAWTTEGEANTRVEGVRACLSSLAGREPGDPGAAPLRGKVPGSAHVPTEGTAPTQGRTR